MDERVLRFRVGVVVLAALIVTVILVMMFGLKPAFLQPKYTIEILFPRAPGIAKNTPVRKDGVPIGRVSGLRLRDEGGVVLTLKIDKGRKLWMNETCYLSTSSLVTGDAILEFVRDPQAALSDPIQDGDYLPNQGVVVSDPMQIMVNIENDMTSALDAIRKAGGSIETLFTSMDEKVDRILNPEQLERVLNGVDGALNSFAETMDSVTELINDPELRKEVKDAAGELPLVMREARATLKEIQLAASDFQGVGGGVRRNLQNIEGLTAALGKKGPPLVDTLERAANQADSLMQQLATMAQRINNGEGSVGRLVQDEQLYEQVVRILQNAEYVSKRLRPIVEDVRVLTDKVSRDPALPLRDAVIGGGLGGLKTGIR